MSSKDSLTWWELLSCSALLSSFLSASCLENKVQCSLWSYWSRGLLYWGGPVLHSSMCLNKGFTLSNMCLLQTTTYAPTIMQPKNHFKTDLVLDLSEGQVGQGALEQLQTHIPSPSTSADVGFLLALLLICYSRTCLISALTLAEN